MAFEVITLNLIPSGDIPVIHAAQYDVDRPLKFALKLGSDDFNPSGYTLELQIRKVDNNIVTAAPSEVTSNVVTFNTTEQMCACSGTNLGEIQITKDDLDIATLHFYLVVQRDVLAGGLTSQSEIHDLEDQIAEIVPEVIGDEYYTAAEVDEKIAEIPTFDPTNYYDKTKLYTKTETNGLLSQKANTSSLANVAFSGSYTDLINTPDIPDVSDYYTKEQTYSQSEVNTLLGQKADTSSLASVATSGDYDDLINKPTIPAAQVNSDWNSSSGVSEILNKPTLATVATSGDYTDLTNKPTVIQYGTELPMSTTDPDKVADRIEALEKANDSSLLYTPTVTEPTLTTGDNHNHRTFYYKHNTKVCLSIGVKNLSTGLMTQSLFTLPSGYRPKYSLSMTCCGYSFDKLSSLQILDNGGVLVQYTQDQGCFGYIEFDAYS